MKNTKLAVAVLITLLVLFTLGFNSNVFAAPSHIPPEILATINTNVPGTNGYYAIVTHTTNGTPVWVAQSAYTPGSQTRAALHVFINGSYVLSTPMITGTYSFVHDFVAGGISYTIIVRAHGNQLAGFRKVYQDDGNGSVLIPKPTPEPSPVPSPEPSPEPSPIPSPEPSPEPSPVPSPESSPEPSPVPSPQPSPESSPESTPESSPEPALEPTPEPSPGPSPEPSPVPSPQPSPKPSPESTPESSPEPSLEPTPEPSPEPSLEPTPIPIPELSNDEEITNSERSSNQRPINRTERQISEEIKEIDDSDISEKTYNTNDISQEIYEAEIPVEHPTHSEDFEEDIVTFKETTTTDIIEETIIETTEETTMTNITQTPRRASPQTSDGTLPWKAFGLSFAGFWTAIIILAKRISKNE